MRRTKVASTRTVAGTSTQLITETVETTAKTTIQTSYRHMQLSVDRDVRSKCLMAIWLTDTVQAWYESINCYITP